MCSSLLVLRAPGSPLPLPHRHRTSAHLTSTLPLPRRDPHHHQYSPTSAFEDSPSLPFATRHRIGVTVAGPSFKVSNETEWCNITTAEVELSFYKPGTSLPDAPVPVAASNLHLPPDSCAAGNIHPDSDVACVDRPCNRSQPDPLHKQTRSTCCSHCNADAGCGSCTYNMRCTAVVRQCSLPYLCLRLQPHSLPYNHSPHFLCSSPCCRPPFRVARGPTRTRAEQRGLLFDFCWRHHGHYSPSGQCGGDKGSSAAANTAVTIAVTKRRIHRAQAASCLCTGCRRKAMGLACRGHRYGYVLLRTCASGCNRSRRAARVFGRWTGDHHPPMTVSL